MLVYKTFAPIVSIILPTFNREKLISRAVESVIKQSFKNWELIIVDDGSSDNTFLVISEFIKSHESIRYIKHSNRKPPLSLNAGILASCGKYIAFLISDDEYKTDFLLKRISFMEENTDVDLIHGGVEIIGHPYVKDKNNLTKEIHLSECAIGGTFFGKRNIFFELGGFRNLSYSDDSDFIERAEKKYKIIKIDWPDYIYYRDTPDSICTNIE